MAWTAVVVSRQVVVSVQLLSPATFNIAAGATHQASAQALFANGDAAPRAIAWSTSNAAIATVNASTGLVTGVAAGTVTITATCEGKTATTAGTITSPTQNAVASVVPSIPSGTVVEGGGLTFTVQARDSSGAVLPGKTFTAVSSHPSKASVGVSGSTITVTGILTGAPSPAITVTCETINSAAVTITVNAPVGAAFDPAAFGMTRVLTRHYNSKGSTNPATGYGNGYGTGSLPDMVGESEGMDDIERTRPNIISINDPLGSGDKCLQFLYSAGTYTTSPSPGVSQMFGLNTHSIYAPFSTAIRQTSKWMYAKMRVMWSDTFWGNPTSTNKLVFFRATSTIEPILRARGVGGGPLVLNVDFQGSFGAGGEPMAATGGANPNTPGAAGVGANAIPRGVPHDIEILLGIGTPGNADGELHIWMNAVKTHEYAPGGIGGGIRYHRNGVTQKYWAYWHQQPVWGGGGGTIPADMSIYMYMVECWFMA